MEVVRTTTPLPDFYIDEYGMEQLKDYLRVSTAKLNTEELDWLRATCLAVVWRHRTKWNRTALVGELLSIAKEFAQEILVEDAEMSPWVYRPFLLFLSLFDRVYSYVAFHIRV